MKNKLKLKVLVACEYSATVRDAFAALGHDAWSCDLLPSDKGGKHIQGNVLDILDQGWDLMIAHPPCTYLTNSGVCWLWQKGKKNVKVQDRWDLLDEGAAFFRALLECDIPRIAIENPIPHKYAVSRIGRKYDQLVQPYHFGHMESKATCFWLKGLQPLRHTSNLRAATLALPYEERNRLHYLPPSKDRWKIRSQTYQGIADAIADQWGAEVSQQYALPF